MLNLAALPKTIELLRTDCDGPAFKYIDQRFLPTELREITTQKSQDVCDAIACLGVRGAPAIGLAGAAAVVLWMAEHPRFSLPEFKKACAHIASVRPTAVNLAWAVQKLQTFVEMQIQGGVAGETLLNNSYTYVKDLEEADVATNIAIGQNGAALIPPKARILTHCNAGSLATAFYGTALGVIYAAAEEGKVEHVYADETRPLGQGARLTVWELAQAGVPVTLQCDNMAASLMAQGKVDCVIVGADRIAKNGDTANKIGTYGLAVLAQYHRIPFYVAAPLSTFDFSLETGAEIPIEQRAASEVLPREIEGVGVYNPAFDVTPGELIAGFITERGVHQAKDIAGLAQG